MEKTMSKSNTTAGLTVADDLTIDINSITAASIGSLYNCAISHTTPAHTALLAILYQNALITIQLEDAEHVGIAGENGLFDHNNNSDWSDSDC